MRYGDLSFAGDARFLFHRGISLTISYHCVIIGVLTDANLSRSSQSAPIPVSTPLAPRSTRRSEFLIANPRLEINPNHRKLSPLQIPNRERIAIFHCTFSVLSGPQPPASSLQNLIVTPRLEFPATRTKQTSEPISTRYKHGLLPAVRVVRASEIIARGRVSFSAHGSK